MSRKLMYRCSEALRCGRSVLFIVTIAALAVQTGAAGEVVSGLALGKALPQHQVVRCLFNEGRAVIRCGEQLLVVRAGDVLPESDARVVEISPQRMVIARGFPEAEGDTQDAQMSGTMLVITRGPGGRLQLVEISSNPDDPQDRIIGVAMRRPAETTPGEPQQEESASTASTGGDDR